MKSFRREQQASLDFSMIIVHYDPFFFTEECFAVLARLFKRPALINPKSDISIMDIRVVRDYPLSCFGGCLDDGLAD